MATRIFVGHEQGEHTLSTEQAFLFDSVTGWAFGPMFREDEETGESAEDRAQAFLDWLAETEGSVHEYGDARQIPPGDLERLYGLWLEAAKAKIQ
jgi:hypothetical protein